MFLEELLRAETLARPLRHRGLHLGSGSDGLRLLDFDDNGVRRDPAALNATGPSNPPGSVTAYSRRAYPPGGS